MIAPPVELRHVFCVHRSGQGDAAALQGMNLKLAAGELLAVLGPSGAGKSTLLRVISGLQVPEAGTVQVLGRDIGRLPARARAHIRHRSLGFLSQRADAVLPPELPARSAIALTLALRGVGRRERDARIKELLEATELTDAAGARPGELSGGERQRVALCVALAHRPSVLLADEPTAELDASAAARARELIARVVRDHGASAIVVSHDPSMGEIADRTIRIRDGRVVEEERGAEPTLTVVDGGWLRLPDAVLASAGITHRARVRTEPGRVVLTAASPPAGRASPQLPGPAVDPARVELHGVSHRYARGRQVLAHLSHVFAPGRLTVVAGPSGSGKTTLLRLLAGLERPLAGEVLLDGQPLARHDAQALAARRRARIGYLPQEPSPVGFLSAEENVILALRIRGWEREPAAIRAADVLARVGVGEQRRQRVSRLSAGETQRVALARALAAAGGLLLVDEPTSRLDEANAGAVASLLGAEAAAGQTVICATHDPLLIGSADEVVEIDAAQITSA